MTFSWKESEKRERELTEKRHYGVIAQDVEKVIPEIVIEGQNNKKVKIDQLPGDSIRTSIN